jgi:hypothetical protein
LKILLRKVSPDERLKSVRKISTALFCSALLLAATHGSAALIASPSSSTNPQTAENNKSQETVDLKISGMT